ncbi:glycoside hydrolase family 5 protein [Polaribacter batillariae]|uniref:Glycoside hydrolase family 5 protein n=1 Tax=Polaribacter batillariae TaxID=2808900 RepID=A0ABX7SZR6_9FLAO|nr:glycoside hydrolase family 5 protein [Polaribacter batillariae]QTD38491.1 glycoside hydrolase family 5 protein [Polaribacter batillariae]
MPSITTENSVVAKNGFLSVDGNKIVNEKGEPVSFAGNSLFWSNDYYRGNEFYNKEVVRFLKEDWNAQIIRIPMTADPDIHDSYIFDPETNQAKLETVVAACLELGLYVIIDWHSHRAEDNEKEAIAFFTNMATKYGKHPNIIYEIYNEPLDVSWNEVIKPYAEKVIEAIRKIDKKNIIVVGTPKWSQDVDIASENPIKGFKNIAYTLHFYAGSHKEWLMNKAQKAIDNGIALMVTEWGSVNANGNGEVNAKSVKKWMDFMEKNNITHCNWSINSKEEGASALKPGSNIYGNWKHEDLTASGKLAKFYIKKAAN